MTLYKSPMSGVAFPLQTLATTGNGNVAVIPSSFRRHKINIKGLATISAGAIQIETANDPAYTGVWNPLGGGPITVVDISELEYTFEGIFQALRARVSTDIVGGTVSVEYVGAQG